MTLVQELLKVDIGVTPQALNNSNVTGAYFPLRDFRRAVAVLHGGAMAATKTTTIEFLQAKDALGTDSKALDPACSSTVIANTNVSETTLTLLSVTSGDEVTINGVIFTAHSNTTTAANREFSVSGNDAADASELIALINDATYGVPGIKASAQSAVITLKAVIPGETLLTVSADSTITIATTKFQALVEASHFDLDYENEFTNIAAKVTTTANSVVSVSLLRGDSRDGVIPLE